MGLDRLLSCLREFVLPETCRSCGQIPAGVPWFQGKWQGARPDPHLCARCWQRLVQGDPVEASLRLASGKLIPVLGARKTGPLMVQLVGDWKYRGVRGLVLPLAALLAEAVARDSGGGMKGMTLVPVPLHGARRRRRGFNQSAVLARELAGILGCPLGEDWLSRHRATGQQARLGTVEERGSNLRDAFVAGSGLRSGSRTILVDDLVTSGSTVAAAASALQEAGAPVHRVFCLGLAGGGIVPGTDSG